MGREERWTVAGLLALAAVIYAVARLFGGPATYLDPAPPTPARAGLSPASPSHSPR